MPLRWCAAALLCVTALLPLWFTAAGTGCAVAAAEISSERVRFTRNRAVHWAAWCRKAFLQMPGYEGTVDDVCAALLADPRIAPLLDHRVYASRRRTPCWVKRVLSTLTQIPGLVKTGEKQGKLIVYRYDSEVTAAAARRRLQHSCVSYCCCCPA
eukprot:XP_001694314.1 predicted protein [Chlamydomonas reinhardtii]